MFRSPLLRRCFDLGIIASLLTASLYAAGKKPVKDPARETVKPAAATAQVRIWKGEFPSKRAVSVTYKPAGKTATPTEFDGLNDSYSFTGYLRVPAEDLVFEFFDAADKTQKLSEQVVQAGSDDLITLILSEQKGEFHTELLHDALPSPKTTVAELTVRNFVPTLTDLEIKIGDGTRITLHAPDSFAQLRGLPLQALKVETSGSLGADKPFSISNDVNFDRFRKATLLIYPDPYGRIRPRLVIEDGSNSTEPKSAAAASR